MQFTSKPELVEWLDEDASFDALANNAAVQLDIPIPDTVSKTGRIVGVAINKADAGDMDVIFYTSDSFASNKRLAVVHVDSPEQVAAAGDYFGDAGLIDVAVVDDDAKNIGKTGEVRPELHVEVINRTGGALAASPDVDIRITFVSSEMVV